MESGSLIDDDIDMLNHDEMVVIFSLVSPFTNKNEKEPGLF